jgi:hypothetical protein
MDADPREDLDRAQHGARVEAGLSDSDSADQEVEKWSEEEQAEDMEQAEETDEACGAAGATAPGARGDGGHRGMGFACGDPPPGETKGSDSDAARQPRRCQAPAASMDSGTGDYLAGLRGVGRHGFGGSGYLGETKDGDSAAPPLGGRSYCGDEDDIASLDPHENCTGERNCGSFSSPGGRGHQHWVEWFDGVVAAHNPYCLRLLDEIRAHEVRITAAIHEIRGGVVRTRLARHRSEFYPRPTMGIGSSVVVRCVTQCVRVSVCVCVCVCVCVVMCVLCPLAFTFSRIRVRGG